MFVMRHLVFTKTNTNESFTGFTNFNGPESCSWSDCPKKLIKIVPIKPMAIGFLKSKAYFRHIEF